MEIVDKSREDRFTTRWETKMPEGGIDEVFKSIRGALPRALRGESTTIFVKGEEPEDWGLPVEEDNLSWDVYLSARSGSRGCVIGFLSLQGGGILTWNARSAYAEGDERYWPSRRVGHPSHPKPVTPLSSWEEAVARDITAAALHRVAERAVAPHGMRSDGVIWHGGAQFRPLDEADDLHGAAEVLASGLEETLWRNSVSYLSDIFRTDIESLLGAKEVTLTTSKGSLTMTRGRCKKVSWSGMPLSPRTSLTMITDTYGRERGEMALGATWHHVDNKGHNFVLSCIRDVTNRYRLSGQITWK
jgi:hypothetical protein